MAEQTGKRHKVPGEFEDENMILFGGDTMKSILERLKSFQMRDGDISVMSYTKTGTTWIQNIVLHLLDKSVSSDIPLHVHFLFLEWAIRDEQTGDLLLDIAEGMSGPRLMKTHLPLRYFKDDVIKQNGAKFLVPMRNPKDVLVSYFHFYQTTGVFGPFKGSWQEFFDMYKSKKLVFGDIFDFYADWWAMRDKPNVMIVMYEDMKTDLAGTVQRIADFLGVKLSNEKLEDVVHKSSFNYMKKNFVFSKDAGYDESWARNHLIRKGETGGWRKYFSESQSKYVDQAVKERLHPIGLKFYD